MAEMIKAVVRDRNKRASTLFRTAFVVAAGLIFAIAGGAKIWSALGDSKLLGVVDPIIGIPFKHLVLLVGGGELVIAVICFGKKQTLALWLTAWMATNFAVYRVGLWWIGWKKPCGCLGNLTDALHISPNVAESLTILALAYLLIGSYGFLFWSSKDQATQGC